MKYKLKSPLQPSGKMEVTPEQSECLQRELFKMGYSWFYNNGISYLNNKYLYWEANNLETGKLKSDFEEDYRIVHTFTDHFETINNE